MTETSSGPLRLPLSGLPWRTGALLAVCLGLSVWAPLQDAGASEPTGRFALLALDQANPWEAWRWLSAHFLHTGADHLLWNAAALLLLGTLIERGGDGPRKLWAAVATGALAVSLWFFLAGNDRYYCGLSGLLNTLLIVALAHGHRSLRAQRPDSGKGTRPATGLLWLIGAGAFAKTGYELWAGTALLTDPAWPAAPGAHLAGLIAGCALVASRRFLTGHS